MQFEETRLPSKAHVLEMSGREKLSLSGVEDVSAFDESTVILSTCQGELSIRGEQLHIDKIDLDSGRLEVHGHICEMSYDEPVQSGGFWARLFG